ncbi:U4/U6.U5 tri-snRNP-associated protein 1 [Achroia grisella]|uniref:U4/U6.U5 tri-snRNP-associated protein 1 n=1 Tax=Achroia grisella TaxID=688607 RepID=UPI0027D23A9D|nr:U4/U6.U5 tri-snRNP-associated protein 1 [Achroia grisella]
MGSSKKHKKESKKKKHRSRSRSPLGGERERKRHRKHKDRKKDRSPDVEEVPVDSHLLVADAAASLSHSRSRSSSVERRGYRENSYGDKDHENDREHVREPSPVATSTTAQESLSIEETNKLRAKLGLKPLEVAEKPADDGKIKDDLGEFYHKPATNITQQKKSEKIREKLEERREKRKLEQKLQTTLLAEESDDEDAIAWVKKTREIEKQKSEAAKRAAMLDEMDSVFGVSALVEEDEREARADRYGAAHLRGLRVAHDVDALGDEREIVLTLADKEVLAEDAEDVLVNVNIVDDERYKKNIEQRKKAKAGYQAYDDEADMEAAALGYQKPVLSKYDDEIDKDKAEKRRGFFIGDEDAIEAKRFKEMMRRSVASGPERRLESLQLPELQLAADYMDHHEIQAKFKKSKRKGKIRKKAKQEPIDVDDYEAGTVPLDTDDTEVKPEDLATGVGADDEDETEPDSELQAALARARRLRLMQPAHKVEEILERVKKEEPEDEEEGVAESGSATMVLDATAEFCRTLGDIPTYGLAGNRDHQAEIMDFEREDLEPEPETSSNAGAWSRVDVGSEKPADLAAGSVVGLEAEPALGAGVAGALQLALSKGYLERAGAAPAPRSQLAHLLAARHYSIEDKALGGEDDKYGRRERGGHSGPLQDFREKSNFRPNIKLEYVDDEGRPLCPKEAFRYLSHKFHGKGPGKNKQEKRIKKAVQEGLMKKMSSTDTPLGTLQMLQDKQRETQSPYIVLSGAKRDPNN